MISLYKLRTRKCAVCRSEPVNNTRCQERWCQRKATAGTCILYMCMCMCICMYIYIYVYIYIHTYIHACVCMCIYIYIHMYMHYIYIYIERERYTHVYTHAGNDTNNDIQLMYTLSYRTGAQLQALRRDE